MRLKPKSPYNGLTVVLSNPSRFDKASLLSANGGYIFQQAIAPLSRFACDIRTKEEMSDLLPETKCILLLGESAMHTWCPDTVGNTLNELRGTPLYFNKNIPCIASYFPQDCADIKNYEAEFNKQTDEAEIIENEDDEGDDKRRHGRTKRKNYGFWLNKDVAKCKQILANIWVLIKDENKFDYCIYPKLDLVVSLLKGIENKLLFIDIETDMQRNMLCFSFNAEGCSTIYVVPVLSPDYTLAYTNLHHIFAALAYCAKRNTLVAHNGAKFDFPILMDKYRIPLFKLEDTLLMMHRCFPDVEKSLGHCGSLWTWLPFHKDEGNVGYNTISQAQQMWQYCGKDVNALVQIYYAIKKYAKTIPGLTASINQANESILPYMIMSLQGIRYDNKEIESIWNYNDRMMKQYLRLLEYLVGKETLEKIRGKGKSVMPTSNKQCCEYFHNLLGYPVVARGKEKADGTRSPSLGKKAIFKLRLKQENPVLDIVIAYRELAKESSSLRFEPWKE